MQKQHFIWKDSQQINHYVYEWLPDGTSDNKSDCANCTWHVRDGR